MTRVVVVSDTHLGVKTEHFRDNWAVARDWITAAAPDLVINAGDISLDGADLAEDLALAADWHDALPCPWLVVPGNHDIGDHPAAASSRQPITNVRRQRYLDAMGSDRWHHDIPGWRLIGFNALLIGSGLDAETDQAAWLRETVEQAAGAKLALFLHKPFFIDRADEAALTYWTVDPVARAAYRWLLDHDDLRLVLSGHLHQYRETTHGRAKVVWAPSVAFVVGYGMQEELGGLRETGLLDLRFGDDAVEIEFHRLPGLADTRIDDIIGEIYPPLPATTD
jgi:3',5'-cyclic AMP phosphodiesterase CpdA